MSPLDLDPTFESMSGLITIRNFVMTVCLVWFALHALYLIMILLSGS